ncbi:PWWP domain-containing DNA repair factor 3A isoform X3 [Eublepharis macularius]|uniref:PWWP domain-containing DNA repair factor 3A isoform X3 n=1 Tax=Eublepharis macularius TaxID=481883 RepID=A0AA97JHH2_EUBMA|nr:PWWP domain-containing DNA repair factor 3A isoform X3 [Eublepharis macularius]
MNEGEYVLCKWKKRLWPAKILSRSCASRKRQAPKDAATFFLVEILGPDKQAKVRHADVEPLKEESIGSIASKLAQNTKSHKVVEELIYRGALRKALNILHQDASFKEKSLLEMGKSKVVAWKEVKEPSSSTHGTVHHLPSSQNDTQQRREKTSEASAVLEIGSTQYKRWLRSGAKAEGSSSANRRSPCLSKGDERHYQDKSRSERSSPSTTSPCLVRTSPPAHSFHNWAKSTPDKKLGGKLGVSGELLGSLVNCPSAEVIEDPSEKEEFPPRKYSKDMSGQKRPQDSEGTCQKPTPVVASLGWERRCASLHESSAYSPDPVGPNLDRIQEENPCPCGDEAKNSLFCYLEEKAGRRSSTDPERRLSPIRESCLSSAFEAEEATEDEEELPSILLYQEPCLMETGMLVWCKLRRYPYWPAVVKNVRRKAKKASVLLIEKCMDVKKSKRFSFYLRNLKHFDCEEKDMLIDKARESFQDEINWCIDLIADYRIRVEGMEEGKMAGAELVNPFLAEPLITFSPQDLCFFLVSSSLMSLLTSCHSFTGTFLEYCADDMSYPVRKQTHHILSQISFPRKEEGDSEVPPPEEGDSEKPPPEATPTKPAKKVLPDRMRAARDKANKKIVEFIVKAKGADEHLRAILKSKKQSRWLNEFLSPPPYLTCIETYLEDDDQQDLVVKYLQGVYREVDAQLLPCSNGDSIVLDVLFPEAIIYAISAVDRIDYKKAEEKYMKGPLLSHREREKFEEEILEKKKKQQQQTLSPEDGL